METDEDKDDVSLPRRQKEVALVRIRESSGCARISGEGGTREEEEKEKKERRKGGRSWDRRKERGREDMSAVESALDVLSRAATMVQGQFIPFGIFCDSREP